jgi:hypothetical protein
METGFKPQFTWPDWFARTAVIVNSFTKIETTCKHCRSAFVGDRDEVIRWEQMHLAQCMPAREA